MQNRHQPVALRLRQAFAELPEPNRVAMSWADERAGSAAAGVERRGIYDLNQLTAANSALDVETEHSTVTHWTNAASDHGAVWVDLDI